ncbi:MAG: hypothetical protein R3C14_27970 [Caldilineaceae bacterium]
MRIFWTVTRIIAWAYVVAGVALLLMNNTMTPALSRLWPASFLIFVPGWLRAGAAVLLVLAAVLVSVPIWPRRLIMPGLARRASALARLPMWFWVMGAGVLFWLAREQTYYGDAQLKLQLLRTATLQSDPYVWKEPLDSLLAYQLTAFLRPWGWGPDVAVALLSCAAGMVFLFAVLLAAHTLRPTVRGRLLVVLGLLALGSSQLWFGHIENYSLVTAFTLLSIVLALRYLQGRASLWLVGLASGVAVSFHPQALFPALALLLLLRSRQWPRQVMTLALGGAVGPLLTAGALWWLGAPWPDLRHGYAGDPQLFWRLDQLMQPGRLLDIFNNLWLVAPLLPLWLLAAVAAWSQPALRRDQGVRYLTGVAAGLLLYHVTFQNDLPRQADWDLFAIVGPGVTLWGLYLWCKLAPQTAVDRSRADRLWALGPALSCALLFTLLWVGVNHSFTLVRPNAAQRDLYLGRYGLLDLTTLLDQATISPDAPICADATGCERVALTSFTMPQTGDSRPVIFAHAPARIALPLALPAERTFLWLSPALDPMAWGWGGDGVTFVVAIDDGSGENVLWSRHLTPDTPADLDWQEALITLAPYRGQQVTLILRTDPGPAGNDAGDRAGWGMPYLMRGTPDVR